MWFHHPGLSGKQLSKLYSIGLGGLVEDGRVNQLRSLIAAGFNVNCIPFPGTTTLQIAIRYATEDMLEYVTILLEAGASINFQKSTPLLDLICRYTGDPNITNICLNVGRKLIEAGCDVNQLTAIYTIEDHIVVIARAPLMQAIQCKFLEFASLLLDHGADPNIKCESVSACYTPLHMAAMKVDIPAAKLLISANADLHAVSTPIPGTGSDKFFPFQTPLGVICGNDDPSVPFARILLAADSKAEKDVAFKNPTLCAPIKSCLDELRSNPSTLKCLAVNAVRSIVGVPYFKQKITELELPHTVVLDLKIY